MAIQFKSTKEIKAPRIVVYGEPGVGKTTLASQFPNPVLIDLEGGASELEIPTFGFRDDLISIAKDLKSLISEEHDRKTVIIDSLSQLEKIVEKYTLNKKNEERESEGNAPYKTLAEIPYGVGTRLDDAVWKNQIMPLFNLLREKGMAIVIIAHKENYKYAETVDKQFDKTTFLARKNVRTEFEQWADAILFIGYDQTATTVGTGFNKRQVSRTSGARKIYAVDTG